MRIVIALWVCIACSAAHGAANAPVTATESESEIVLENGIISVTISKELGVADSIKLLRGGQPLELSNGRRGLYMDFDGGVDKTSPDDGTLAPGTGHDRPMEKAHCRIVSRGPDIAEVAFAAQPSESFPFTAEMHWVMLPGRSGIFAYVIYGHGAGMPAGTIEQTRFVVKGVPGTKLFTHWIVDDQRSGPYKTGKVVETVQDATERFADGKVCTKYDNTAFTHEFLAHGMAGNGVGIWTLWPSTEFCNGGPLRQDLTVHNNNVLLAMFVSAHFGAPKVRVTQDEQWSHFYGPVFVYINQGDTAEAMHADAKRVASEERAAWPYTWLRNDQYPLARGTVSGQIKLTDGSSTEGAWVVLGPNHEDVDWALSSKGYMFWSKADRDGRFTIEKVRPGAYTLWASGANQFVDFRRDDVQVKANATTDLATLQWQPVTHGRRLWQIGVADRGTTEFMDGDNPRNYDTFLRYFRTFPNDVTFTIGKSVEKKHWYYAQWAWYNKSPQWRVRFDLDQGLRSTATLTLGIASSQPAGELLIKVNGKQVASLILPVKTGAAAYRSASQDSPYTLREVQFDAALLKRGTNNLTLEMTGAQKFPGPEERAKLKRPKGALMYDAIRLEVQP